MWLLRRITSYLYATIDTVLNVLGITKMAFTITAKVTDPDASKRYEQEIMEFGPPSSMLVIIATTALINLFCLVGGLHRAIAVWELRVLEQFFVQILLCGAVVALSLPIYKGLFVRKDKGRMATSVAFTSVAFAALACLLSLV